MKYYIFACLFFISFCPVLAQDEEQYVVTKAKYPPPPSPLADFDIIKCADCKTPKDKKAYFRNTVVELLNSNLSQKELATIKEINKSLPMFAMARFSFDMSGNIIAKETGLKYAHPKINKKVFNKAFLQFPTLVFDSSKITPSKTKVSINLALNYIFTTSDTQKIVLKDASIDTFSTDKTPITEIAFMLVEEAPVHPQCENLKNSKSELKKCLSEEITKHINTHFNRGIVSDLGLTGTVKIYAVFKISKDGTVTDLKTRAPHPKIAAEAKRVINSLPIMTPGKHRGKAVDVKYTLPIAFKAQ